MKTIHTFSESNRESKRLKIGFFMGDARVKATTFHSFKGWESRALVIYAGHISTPKALSLLYTGITRVKRHSQNSYLTVVSAIPELKRYGRTWPNFKET